MKLGIIKKLLCLVTTLAIALPLPAARAQVDPISAAIAAAIAAMTASTVAGTSSIASGTGNVNQGQSTQNQAQMAMGAMQIAQGLLGLLAAAAAADQAGKGQGNQSNLSGLSNPGAYQSTIGTSPTPSSGNSGGTNGTSNTGNTESSTNSVQLTPESIRKGELGAAMSAIEKGFGIPRDDFVKALQNGVDPKELLSKAPKNTPSMDMLGKIEAGLASMNANKAAELAANGVNGSGASTNLASVGGAGTGGAPAGAAGEEAGKPRMPASTAPPEEALDDPNALANANLSPEIKAALAAKAAKIKADKERGDSLSWSIFQLVHNRYKKLEPMLYGRVERTNVKNPGEISRD